MIHHNIRRFFWLYGLMIIPALDSQAEGFRIPYQSAVASGQGFAYAAQADDPSAIYYNPAGLTQVPGLQASFGTTWVGADLEHTSPSGIKTEGDVGQGFAFPSPSHFYISANLPDLGFTALGPLSVGLSVNTPYGLISRYPDGSPFESVVTRARMPMLAIKPTLAYQINHWLSVGIGADIYTFADFIGAGGLEQRSEIPGVGQDEIKVDGTMAGYNLSLLITPWRNADRLPRLNLAFIYRSGGELNMDGDYRINGDKVAHVETALHLPDVYTAALAYWPIRNSHHEWKVEYDMEFINYDNFDSLDFKFSNGAFVSTPANLKSTYMINVGTEFKWLNPEFMPGWTVALRSGYAHSNSPFPDSTFTPAIPDNNWNLFSVGFGLKCQRGGYFLGLFECGRGQGFRPSSISLDVAFKTAFLEPRQMTDNVNPTVNGTYDGMVYLGALSLSLAY